MLKSEYGNPASLLPQQSWFVFHFLTAVCLNITLICLYMLQSNICTHPLLQDYVQAMTGLCYDGLEGLIYLVLFSFVTALMFSSIVCSVPHTWRGKR